MHAHVVSVIFQVTRMKKVFYNIGTFLMYLSILYIYIHLDYLPSMMTDVLIENRDTTNVQTNIIIVFNEKDDDPQILPVDK